MDDKGILDLKEAILYTRNHPKAVIYVSKTYAPTLVDFLTGHGVPVKRSGGLYGNEAVIYDGAEDTLRAEYKPLVPEDIVPLKSKKESSDADL